MPSKMEAPESAKTITVYVNGEQENGDITKNYGSTEPYLQFF